MPLNSIANHDYGSRLSYLYAVPNQYIMLIVLAVSTNLTQRHEKQHHVHVYANVT